METKVWYLRLAQEVFNKHLFIRGEKSQTLIGFIPSSLWVSSRQRFLEPRIPKLLEAPSLSFETTVYALMFQTNFETQKQLDCYHSVFFCKNPSLRQRMPQGLIWIGKCLRTKKKNPFLRQRMPQGLVWIGNVPQDPAPYKKKKKNYPDTVVNTSKQHLTPLNLFYCTQNWALSLKAITSFFSLILSICSINFSWLNNTSISVHSVWNFRK